MMNKMLCLILPALLLTGILPAQELKITGEMWNRWTLENGTAPGDSSDAILRNNFSLERGYIGVEPIFSETIKGRFTVDIFSTDLIKDGAGLKLKYAYVDFGSLIPIPDLTTTIGLQKVYFGTIYDWSYNLIGKAPSDEYKIANSADYGISLNGYIPGGWGEYALGMYNGEGYKNYGANLKDNIDPAFLANLRLTPFAGLTLGGSVMTNGSERKIKLADASANASYNTQLLLDGVLRAAYGPVDLWVEYLNKSVSYAEAFNSKDYTANCLSVFPTLKLKNLTGADIDLVGRYDRWDETDNSSNQNLLTAITGGLNYNFMHDDSANPSMQVQLNYTSKKYDEAVSAVSYANGLKDSETLMLQFKWRFANTINI
jgi:hypothetical protein